MSHILEKNCKHSVSEVDNISKKLIICSLSSNGLNSYELQFIIFFHTHFIYCNCSRLSDLGVLMPDGDSKGTELENIQNEILERKIKGLEKENQEVNEMLQGNKQNIKK